MNAYEIEKRPEINGGKKRMTKEYVHTEINAETGEILHQITESNSYSGAEPDYIKIYTDCQLVFNHLDTALSPYIVAFGHYMTFANFENPVFRCTIQTTQVIREAVAESLGVSDRQVKRAIADLVKSEVFIPIEKKGKRIRGVYFVNPWVMSKGEWKDIKQLRGQFEFVSGASSVLAIGEDGERKVIMPLTQKTNGQLELDTTVSNKKGE